MKPQFFTEFQLLRTLARFLFTALLVVICLIANALQVLIFLNSVLLLLLQLTLFLLFINFYLVFIEITCTLYYFCFQKVFLYYLYYSFVWNKVTYFYLYFIYFSILLYFDESHQGVVVFYWKERLTQAVLNKTYF